MVIVHEATHGRIDDHGIMYLAENRDRIETACVRQETIFARCLPGGDVLARRKTCRNGWPASSNGR